MSRRYIEWFRKMGCDAAIQPADERGARHQLVAGRTHPVRAIRPRASAGSHPPKLSWETERTDRYNRVRWLVIDALGAATSDSAVPDAGYFTHRAVSGRVDVERQGNTFEATTRGVRQFRLLLSPDVVDFSRPVTVTVNGRPAFEGTVAKAPPPCSNGPPATTTGRCSTPPKSSSKCPDPDKAKGRRQKAEGKRQKAEGTGRKAARSAAPTERSEAYYRLTAPKAPPTAVRQSSS